jgi:hypothetical protein
LDALKQVTSLKSQVAGLQSQNATFDARLSAVEEASGILSPSVFSVNNLPLYGIIGVLALWLVKRRK